MGETHHHSLRFVSCVHHEPHRTSCFSSFLKARRIRGRNRLQRWRHLTKHELPSSMTLKGRDTVYPIGSMVAWYIYLCGKHTNQPNVGT